MRGHGGMRLRSRWWCGSIRAITASALLRMRLMRLLLLHSKVRRVAGIASCDGSATSRVESVAGTSARIARADGRAHQQRCYWSSETGTRLLLLMMLLLLLMRLPPQSSQTAGAASEGKAKRGLCSSTSSRPSGSVCGRRIRLRTSGIDVVSRHRAERRCWLRRLRDPPHAAATAKQARRLCAP
jgi:hypothetical protein